MSYFDQVRSHDNSTPRIPSGSFGPAYDPELDGPRLKHQHKRIRDWMLARNDWKTLAEIQQALDFPETSISAQLRHLRKAQYGSYRVQKRRRKSGRVVWEYRILPPEKPGQVSLFDESTERDQAR